MIIAAVSNMAVVGPSTRRSEVLLVFRCDFSACRPDSRFRIAWVLRASRRSDPSMPRIPLYEIAFARSGDKGDSSNVGLFVPEQRRAALHGLLKAAVPMVIGGFFLLVFLAFAYGNWE